MNSINKLIDQMLPRIIEIRQKLHQMPELKFEEVQTAALIMKTLSSFGIASKGKVAKTGVVALIDSGKPGKTIALRADMDALPIQEQTGLPYQSKYENRMHACGHDGHTATLLLTVFLLQQMREKFSGKVKLIFQPAEEGGKGSTAMIQEGVLHNPKVDAIFGWHIWPGLSLGHVGTRIGSLLAGNGRFEINIQGKVAHMSMPDLAINPITIGSALIIAINSLRDKYKQYFAVINIIRFESGEMRGGMTDSAKIIGVYFVESDEILTKIKADIQNEIEKIITTSGSTININYFPFHNATINSKKETEIVLQTASELLPAENIKILPTVQTASEDFSEYLSHIPGCFFLIGAGIESPPVHTNQFDFPDKVIAIAAKMLSTITINFLTR